MTTKSIILKAWSENNETITAFQGEVDSRFLQITLEDNNGAIDLTNKNIQFYAKKPDGTVIFNDATILDSNKGVVNIVLTSEMSAACGVMSDCEIRVTDEKGSTLKFNGLNIIIKKALPDSEVESSSEFTALQKAISETSKMGKHQELKNNPHSVTSEQIGAAKIEHSHDFDDINNTPTTLEGYGITDAVSNTLTINSKPLSDNVVLVADDIGAAKVDHSHDFDEINNTPTTLEGYGITDAVSNTLTINNKPLSDNIVLTTADIGAATSEQGNKADTAIQNSEKGSANGVATLDSNSKLVQMPTAEDISAVPITRTINSKSLSNDITLSATDIGAIPDTTSIPTKVSDLQNDSGFITSYTETDPTVPSWAKSASKPSYSFSELTSKPTTISGYGITDAASATHTHSEASTSEAGFLNTNDKAKLNKINIASNNYLRLDCLVVSGNGAMTVPYSSASVGDLNTVSSANCLAAGYNCKASGNNSFSSGFGSTASGWVSAAIGNTASATGNSAISAGHNTTAKAYNFACGRFNTATASSDSGTTGDMFIVGNGTSTTAKNAFRITASGSVLANSSYSSTGADYAELFEWADSNVNEDDRRGLFVTLEENKIRLANSQDTYILGIVSGNPSVIGDNFDDDWCGKYLTDVFGTPILENKTFPEITDENGNIIQEAYEDKCFVLNPSFDPTQTYIPRTKRKEWATIGIVGKLVVIDDGTCQVNGYCYPLQNGIATNSTNPTNYRVTKRIDETHIQVFIK